MHNDEITEVLEACAKRRKERRSFMRLAGTTGLAVAGGSLLAACGDDHNGNVTAPVPTPSPSSTATPTPTAFADPDVLNYALNLEYLEANFYLFATTGSGLPASMMTGTGTQGQAMGGRAVNFQDPMVAAYAREITGDEQAHVALLRSALGSSAVAQPAIDLSVSPTSAFSLAAQAAGIIPSGKSFDPYSSDEFFLLGAFLFEDVGVTAYKGAITSISNKTYLDVAAGIHGAEAYHAGLVRTTLFSKGIQMPNANLIQYTTDISDARDSLDGPSDDDQGIAIQTDANGNQMSNIVPTDSNGIAYSRRPGDVLNIVYLTKMAAMKGGFFPNGVNGVINQSAANS